MLKKRNTRDINVSPVEKPELIFGLVGPMGVDLTAVSESLTRSLQEMKYKSTLIHLTNFIPFRRLDVSIDESTFFSRYKSLIDCGNAFCQQAGDNAAMAGIAISQIRRERAKITGDEKIPDYGRAYILRQFKRPEEISSMRAVYGSKFIQVSVSGSVTDRKRILEDKIRSYDLSPKNQSLCERQAIELIDLDHNQKDMRHGQRLSDVFHLGDVFVEGINRGRIDETIKRFMRAFFGATESSPNKDEYGLYTAKAAALRSVDLSRQVGAAIFTKRGDIIALGCNEVPRANGGAYWSDDTPPIARDVELKVDPNHARKNEIFYDIVSRFNKAGLLSRKAKTAAPIKNLVRELISIDFFKDAQIMDIIEYGRAIHAEMAAITDAARLGQTTFGATLYCTTFPCHLCAKHIVAAGIDRVVFLEPYPKSYAEKLHKDSITLEIADNKRVLFEPFIGISPLRYKEIFEKTRRKDENGRAKDWYNDKPSPLLDDRTLSYIYNEEPFAYRLLKGLKLLKRPNISAPVKRKRKKKR